MAAKQRLSAEERRAQTLERVTRVFSTKGFSGTTSAELARAADVSEALLYKLFGSKRGIYQAMLQHKLDTVGWGEFRFQYDAETPESTFFRAMVEEILAKLDQDADFARLMLYSSLQGSEFAQLFHECAGKSIMTRVADYLRLRIAAGYLRPVEPSQAAYAFLCMAWQMGLNARVFPDKGIGAEIDESALVTSAVEIFVRGLQP